MPAYPANFPCPQAQPYSWSVDAGLLRTQMDGGYARQRRLYDVMPHHFVLEFVMPIGLLHDWQSWVNTNGWNYFELMLVTWLSSPSDRPVAHNARFTSNLDITLEEQRSVRIRVEAELSPVPLASTTTLFDRSLEENWQSTVVAKEAPS